MTRGWKTARERVPRDRATHRLSIGRELLVEAGWSALFRSKKRQFNLEGCDQTGDGELQRRGILNSPLSGKWRLGWFLNRPPYPITPRAPRVRPRLCRETSARKKESQRLGWKDWRSKGEGRWIEKKGEALGSRFVDARRFVGNRRFALLTASNGRKREKGETKGNNIRARGAR